MNNNKVNALQGEIIKRYVDLGYDATKTAKELGLCTSTVTKNLRKWGIEVRHPHPIGSKCPTWKGGRVKEHGYWLVRLEPTDFFHPMCKANGYCYEHRLVMAKHLNRHLLPWEVVHHKNGQKDDNRLENLQLLPHISYHLVDSGLKHKIAILNKRIRTLEEENVELRNQLLGSHL